MASASAPQGSATAGSGSEDSYRVEITQDAHEMLPWKAEVTCPNGRYGSTHHASSRNGALADAKAWIKRDRELSHEPEVLYL